MAGKDYYGDYGNVSMPKKAIQAQEIIYQASAMQAVASQAGVPTTQTNDLIYKQDVTRSRVGMDDVAVDAGFDHTRLVYKPMRADLKWSIYPYMITDGSKIISRDPNVMWKDAVTSASEFFAAIRDYRVLANFRSSNGTSATAAGTANWDAANADVEKDILTALAYITANSNIQNGEKISVIMPADVSFEVKKLTLVKNIQRTMQDYLEQSFNIQFYTYRAMLDDAGTATYDGLSTSALVFVQGNKTAQALEFSPAEAARRGVPLVEHSRIHGRGDQYTQKIATGCLVTWDGINTYSETAPLTNRIYEITSVT
jgi:hypothetical protein